MSASRDMEKNVFDHATNILKIRGYKAHPDQIFTKKVSPEVLGWMGLNSAVTYANTEIMIHPFVGVRHQEIERKLAEIRGQSFHQYIPPTVRVHIMYLVPDNNYENWVYNEDVDIDSRVADMVEQIDHFGTLFMHAHTDLISLADRMETGKYGHPESRAFRLPLVYLLLGEPDRALHWVDHFENELDTREDPAALQFREYAEKFRSLL